MKTVNIIGTVKISNHCNGTAAFARDVIDGLQKKGYDIAFYSLGNRNSNSNIQTFLRKIWWRFIRIASKYKIDIIFVVILMLKFFHFFRRLAKKNLDGAFLCNDVLCAQVALFLTKNNVILVTHFAIPPWDEFVRGGFISNNSLGYYVLRKWMLFAFNNERLRFIFISDESKKQVCHLVPKADKRGEIIYNGVSVEPSDEPLRILTCKKYIVNVGSLCENKHQELFINVAAILNKKLPNLYFVLVGNGDPSYMLSLKQQVIDKDLSERVIFTGMLSQRETYAVLSSAVMYFHTSRSESFGRVLVEAMGHGVITCCMEYPAAYEIIGNDKDLIFPITFTPEQISAKIYNLLTNDMFLRKKRKEQNKIFFERFYIDIMIDKIEDYLIDKSNNFY